MEWEPAYVSSRTLCTLMVNFLTMMTGRVWGVSRVRSESQLEQRKRREKSQPLWQPSAVPVGGQWSLQWHRAAHAVLSAGSRDSPVSSLDGYRVIF